jgi:hypothetical protein
LSRWEGLTLFIEDGRIELDNNTVERSIRPSPSTGKMLCSQVRTAAPNTASLIETCKLNDVDPLTYLTDVLTRIVGSSMVIQTAPSISSCPGPTESKT